MFVIVRCIEPNTRLDAGTLAGWNPTLPSRLPIRQLLLPAYSTFDIRPMMGASFQPADPVRFEAALRRFDEENSRDSNQVEAEGALQPRELVYARWLTGWVLRLCPEASEELRLAARSQHLCRWAIPRQSYPMTRAGYLQWREALKRFHAEKAGEILREIGYPEAVIARVQRLNLKKDFPLDADTRVLEDALCLVFLEHQLPELATRQSEEKMLEVLRKTWKKMTPLAHRAALALPYRPADKGLLERALESVQ